MMKDSDKIVILLEEILEVLKHDKQLHIIERPSITFPRIKGTRTRMRSAVRYGIK